VWRLHAEREAQHERLPGGDRHGLTLMRPLVVKG
jgi:hypothetical protein